MESAEEKKFFGLKPKTRFMNQMPSCLLEIRCSLKNSFTMRYFYYSSPSKTTPMCCIREIRFLFNVTKPLNATQLRLERLLRIH
jgi:hypothetical protein